MLWEYFNIYSGSASYSYNWSSETNSSITVSPASTTTYTVDVTSGSTTCQDSVVVTVNPTLEISIDSTACDSIQWAGNWITASGTYTDSLQSLTGCDSIVTLNLTITPYTAQAGDDFAISCVDNAISGTFPTTGRSLGIGDDANNYPFGTVWADGQDYGSGMNPWSINTTPGQGGAGAFVGNPQSDGMGIVGIGDKAFGLYSTSTFYVNAQAEFTSPMAVGDELTFYWAINWDSNSGGKGFDLKSNGTTVYTVINNNSQNITAGGVIAESVYGTTPMLVTLKRTSQSTYEFTMTKRSSGAPYTTTISSSSAINQVNFFCGNQNLEGGQRNLYFNKLNMVKQSGATYAWSPSAGLSATNIPNPIASPTATTNYVLTVTSADGCESTDSVLVTVNDSITVDAGSDVTICEGNALSLSGTGSESNYSWSGPDGFSSSDLNASVSTNATTAMGGDYVLSMTDTAGCVATDTISVTVSPLTTEFNYGGDTTFCQGR